MDNKISSVEYDFFMDRYVTLDETPLGRSLDTCLSKFKWDGTIRPEAKMCTKLAKAINSSWLWDMRGDFEVVATQDKADSTDDTKQRVDIAIYRTESAPEGDKGDPANWAAVELCIECKTEDVSDDPFDDEAPNFEPKSDRRKANLGQIMSYASLVFAKQHRTHLFTVVCFGHWARIVRWDRSGVVVTKKFNYREDAGSTKLGTFFWRFVRLTDAQRGHDPTVKVVKTGSHDDQLMERRANEPLMNRIGGHEIGKHARLMFEASLKASTQQRYRITVHTSEGPKDFLVGAPHFLSTTLAGRGTRGFVAVRCDDEEGPLCYFKDAWRVAHDSIEKEGDILAYLNDPSTGKVEGIPSLVCHGDVQDQETDSQNVWRLTHPDVGFKDCPLKTHRHYRLVVQQVALPMSQFENADELVSLMGDCVSAHAMAYAKGVVHRDISAGNVLIEIKETVQEDGELVVERNGLLTDWELSKRTNAPEGPRQPDRTGTWQFLSAYALLGPGRVITIPDEMEAIFHVLLFYAIRFLRHNCRNVSKFIYDYFEGYEQEEGSAVYICGHYKQVAMKTGDISLQNSDTLEFYLPPEEEAASGSSGGPQNARQIHPITTLINALLARFSARYTLLHHEAKAVLPRPSSSRLAVVLQSGGVRRQRRWGLDDSVTIAEDAEEPLTPDRKKELEAKAAELGNHQAIIKLFFKHITSKPWPLKDTVEDQLRKDFHPDKAPRSLVLPSASELMMSGSTSSRKRSSMHDGDDSEISRLAKRVTRSSARPGAGPA